MSKFIIANWKMYLTMRQSVALAKRISKSKFLNPKFDVVVCPSFVAMEEVAKIIKGTRIKLGAQDIFCCDARGAYTGEIGVDDLGELGVEYVLVGHSERRRYFNESDELVNQKLRAVLTAGMRPILCVGEPKRELGIRNQELGKAKNYVKKQLTHGLKGITRVQLKNLIIAYEPIWAISGNNGHVDTPEDAASMHAYIRSVICGDRISVRTEIRSHCIPILYGGSVNAKNVSAFLRTPGLDGLLIGKASTKASELSEIIHWTTINI